MFHTQYIFKSSHRCIHPRMFCNTSHFFFSASELTNEEMKEYNVKKVVALYQPAPESNKYGLAVLSGARNLNKKRLAEAVGHNGCCIVIDQLGFTMATSNASQ